MVPGKLWAGVVLLGVQGSKILPSLPLGLNSCSLVPRVMLLSHQCLVVERYRELGLEGGLPLIFVQVAIFSLGFVFS